MAEGKNQPDKHKTLTSINHIRTKAHRKDNIQLYVSESSKSYEGFVFDL